MHFNTKVAIIYDIFVYLNLSEGVNWRLNANDSAFDGTVRLGINVSSSSYKIEQSIYYEQHDGEMQIKQGQLRDALPYSDTLYSWHYHCTMQCKLHSEHETSLNHLLIKFSHPHPISSL